MSSLELQKNILATLAYYDVMDYPMTVFEVWKYLTKITNADVDSADKKYSLLGIITELESDNLKKFIEEFRGFYFLKGRKDLVAERIKRDKIANEKYKILLPVAKWLRFVPYVRMIAVTGRLAMKNTETGSDLDLLIVLEHGKIFTGRTLVTFIVHFLGRRRYGKKISNRVCLNYFITQKSLEINLKDIFSASEYSFAFPLFGFEVFREFQKQNNWIKSYKPNFQIDSLPNLKLAGDTWITGVLRKIGEKIFKPDFIENWLKKWQISRIMDDPRTHKDGSMIIANSEMLIFLPEPQGPKIYKKFKEKLNVMLK